MKKILSLLSAVAVALLGNVAVAATVDDVLTSDKFTATDTKYTTFSDVQGASGAVYAGNSAKAATGAIQLRSSNSNSGIVTSATGGNARKVVVTWQGSTSAGRTLDIYGDATPYGAATELYGKPKGTKLGSIVKGTSTELVIEGDYAYIGMRSNSGAMYLMDITITWEQTAAAAVAKPVIEVAEAEPFFKGDVLSVTMSCATEGAEIYYTTDGTEPSAENGTKYEGSAVNVTSAEAGDVKIKAIAVKDADVSGVTTRTVTFADFVDVASVAEFEAQVAETVVRLNFPLTVTYATKNHIFAQDETGNGIWLFAYGSTFSDEDAVNYPNGSVIAAGAIGATTDFRGNKELSFGDYVDRFKALEVTAGEEVTAETVTFPLKAEHLYKLIAVEGVAVAATSTNNKYDISGVELYNNFGITMPTDLEGNKYDITGVCVISDGFYAIYPISIVEHTNTGVGVSRIDGGVSIKAAEGAVMVNGADGKVVVFDAMGRVVKSVSAKGETTVEMPAGYYIVRTAGVAKAVIVK